MTIARLCRTSIAILCAAAGAGSQVTAQSEMTPAELVLKSVNAPPTFGVDVRQALQSTSPALRITAARILAVSGKVPMVPDIVATLASETDPAVATELMRALVLVNTPQSLAAADAYLPRASRSTVEAFTRLLARSQPERLLKQLPSIIDAMDEKSRENVYSSAMRLALRNRPTLREPALRALLEADGPQWGWLVDKLLEDSTLAVDLPTVEAALASSRPEHRERTVWAVVCRLASGEMIPTSLVRGAAPRGDAARTWEALGREAIARIQQTRASSDWSDVIAELGPSHHDDVLALRGLRGLSAGETAALRKVLGALFPVDWTEAESKVKTVPAKAPPDELAPALLRASPTLFPGFLTSLNAAAGCDVPGGGLVGLQIEYAADGRPSTAGLIAETSDGCVRALSALAQVTLADDDVVLGERTRDIVLLPTGSALLGCIEEPGTTSGDVEPQTTAANAIVAPKKTRNVNPRYPAKARQDRMQGTSVLRAVVSASGCVRDLAVVESAGRLLDLESVLAVMQWQYTPTTLNGSPVEVIMSVRVNFTLN